MLCAKDKEHQKNSLSDLFIKGKHEKSLKKSRLNDNVIYVKNE